MYRNLAGLTEKLGIPPYTLLVYVVELNRHPGQEKLPSSLQDRSSYGHSMLLGRLLLNSHYQVLRANRSADEASPVTRA